MKSLGKRVLRSIGLSLLLAGLVAGCWSYVSDEAAQRFKERKGLPSLTVFPVRVVIGGRVDYDAQLAQSVAAFMREEQLADASATDAALQIPLHWQHNQAGMAERSALSFASQVQTIGIRTDYALLVEILCSGKETEVIGVHTFLAERGGLLASGGLTNSHWQEFEDVRPKDRHGGFEVAKRMLRGQWTGN